MISVPVRANGEFFREHVRAIHLKIELICLLIGGDISKSVMLNVIIRLSFHVS